MADVHTLGGGWYLVVDGDRQWRMAIADEADASWIFVDGQVARLPAANTPSTRGRTKSRGEASVMAPMPATVVAINTAPGLQVKEGETVIVLEAMKMELPIKSPRAGTVSAVHCAKGDLVQPGVSLLEIE